MISFFFFTNSIFFGCDKILYFQPPSTECHKSSICLFPQPIYKNIWQGCIFMCDFGIALSWLYFKIFVRNKATGTWYYMHIWKKIIATIFSCFKRLVCTKHETELILPDIIGVPLFTNSWNEGPCLHIDAFFYCPLCLWGWKHSWKKWFCLQDPVFWGWIFLILRMNFPNMEKDFPNFLDNFS